MWHSQLQLRSCCLLVGCLNAAICLADDAWFEQRSWTAAEIAVVADAVREEFKVPGMAVAVVKDGQVVAAEGCG